MYIIGAMQKSEFWMKCVKQINGDKMLQTNELKLVD